MATEQRHIRRIVDTQANARTDLDSGQSAILTDQNEEWVYNNSDASKMFYVANQKYWNGAAFVDCDATFGDVTVNDDLYQSEYRYHLGDTNTYDRFRADRYGWTIGAVEFLDAVEDTVSYIEWNPANNDIDHIWNSTIADTMFIRGSDGVVEIGGTGAATWEKDWHTIALGDNTAITANGATVHIASRTYWDETDSRWEDDGSANTSSLFSMLNGDFTWKASLSSGVLGTATSFVTMLSALHTSGYAGEVVINDDGEYIDLRVESTNRADMFLVDSSADRIAMNGAVGNGILTIQQDDASAMACLVLDQDDESEGFIDYVGSDRGVIAATTNSVASVRVELSGTVYRQALYADA